MRDDELTEAIREVRNRVRARYPEGALGIDGVSVPDLMPLLQARDMAEAKVAAIGQVNPRRGGIANSIVQRFKKLISRALDWHVREQVEFNRGMVQCVQASIEAMTEMNRALSAIARQIQAWQAETVNAHREEMMILGNEARELKDVRKHWLDWRVGWESDHDHHQIRMLRTISELQAAFTHRVTNLEQSMREMAKLQHDDYEGALDRYSEDIQKRLWRDLEYIRAEYQKVIHEELKIIRQKAVAQRALDEVMPAKETRVKPMELDWLRFAENFRGPEGQIRRGQMRYAAKFAGAKNVLDLGCGRGEFLDVARAAGIEAHGIDQSEECIGVCLAKGLKAERGGAVFVSGKSGGFFVGRGVLLASRRAHSSGPAAGFDPVAGAENGGWGAAGGGDSECGMPGDLRIALLSGPHAHASGSGPAAGILYGRSRVRESGSGVAVTGGGEYAGFGRFAGAGAEAVFRGAGLFDLWAAGEYEFVGPWFVVRGSWFVTDPRTTYHELINCSRCEELLGWFCGIIRGGAGSTT